jgi:UDP-N-acetylglucosamine--N-acetylmuramyl-(pentapeptide) pyrophosphoryl-undecaprenol N-acetylglucosamine transferase
VRVLFVASSGGHLEELLALRPRIATGADPVAWATEATPQARELLAGECAWFLPSAPSRDVGGMVRCAPHAWALVRRARFDAVVSTGASIAIPFLAAARARGLEAHYIESAARLAGPSLTGRVLARVPGVRLWSQHAQWASSNDCWGWRGSVFDGFEPGPRKERPLRRVVVALGTTSGYPFLRLLWACARAVPADAAVLWQTGSTRWPDDPPSRRTESDRAVAALSPRALAAAFAAADVVVSHAGVGNALVALRAGKCPLIVPRRKRFGEHVDDHQAELAAWLAERGLAVACEADDLMERHLQEAASRSVTVRSEAAPMLDLTDQRSCAA